MNKIKTFLAACKYLNITPESYLPKLPKGVAAPISKNIIAYAKLILIIKAINMVDNNGHVWKPDWNNIDEYKYMPYFKMKGGFVSYAYYSYLTASSVGSRLCYKNSESVEWAVKQKEILKLYKDYMQQ